MRYWLIGCGSLLLIVIVLGVIGYNWFKDFAEEMQAVVVECEALNDEFPFEKPEDGVITKDFFSAYIACRRGLLDDFDGYIADLENDDTSFTKKVSMGVNMFSAMGGAFTASLRTQAMSPNAYEWLVSQTFLAIKYAEREDAPEELKQLHRALEAVFDGRANDDGEVKVSVGGASTGKTLKEILPNLDPNNISMPEENLAIIVENADALTETKNIFILDHVLLEIMKKDFDKMKEN